MLIPPPSIKIAISRAVSSREPIFDKCVLAPLVPQGVALHDLGTDRSLQCDLIGHIHGFLLRALQPAGWRPGLFTFDRLAVIPRLMGHIDGLIGNIIIGVQPLDVQIGTVLPQALDGIEVILVGPAQYQVVVQADGQIGIRR